MTEEEFTRSLPRLTSNPLPIAPPFLFNNVSVRVFPLRANLDALQQLVDGYLNFIPPEAGKFRVSAPYVMLEVLDYGEIAESVSRIGWFAQTEVFFSVYVEWYQYVNGEWVFNDWAVITPYIFVNDNFSVPLGRGVYGFPKVLAELTPVNSDWPKDPLAPVTLARLKTQVFPEAYAGKGLEDRILMEVQRDAPMSNLQVPPDPLSPLMPWTIASHLAQAVRGFATDAMWVAQSMRISPVGPMTPATFSQMLGRFGAALNPAGNGFVTNSINLKQFRRADAPEKICYQAVTNGPMYTTGFNGGGLLGEERTIAGDLSGGHTIKLFEHPSFHLVQSLGLEVDRRSMGPGGVTVAEIKPLMPMWVNINLRYDKGTNLAWRGQDGVWKNSRGVAFPAPKLSIAKAEAEAPDFNSTVASTVEAIAGPFAYSEVTFRVLPLLAHRKNLQKYVDEFINSAIQKPATAEDGGPPQHMRLRVWARPLASVNHGAEIGGDYTYVYLTTASFDGITSKSNNIGDWAKKELSFLIPVKWERCVSPGNWETVSVGVVPAFTLADGCIAAISRFEVQGIDARTVNFVRPESVWLSSPNEGTPAKQTLLRVNAEVWPVYGAGQKAVTKTIIEISHHDSPEGLSDTESREIPFAWAEVLRLELGTKKGTKARYPNDCKIARAMALELLGNKTPFYMYTMKQFRDVADPDKACYQEVVRIPRSLQEVIDLQEIEEAITVKLCDFPGLDIRETLGILAVPCAAEGSGLTYRAQPVRPFFIKARVEEGLAEPLLRRTHTQSWTLTENALHSTLSSHSGAGTLRSGALPARIVADLKAEKLQDQLDPSRMNAIMFQARQRLNATQQEGLDRARVRAAFDVVDPQMVVEAVLSREWGNANPNARWRQGRAELLELFKSLPSAGGAAAFAQSVMYLKQNNGLATRPGAVASESTRLEWCPCPQENGEPAVEQTFTSKWSVIVAKIVAQEELFTNLRFRMEECFNILSAYEILGFNALRHCEQGGEKPPTAKQVRESQRQILATLKQIEELPIVGEPSAENNLDTQVLANKTRLTILLKHLDEKYAHWCRYAEDPAISEVGAFREVYDLARKYCLAQRDALLNKMSRAYQKPDYCILRDAVGRDNRDLLPDALSWDDNWYYGKEIGSGDVPPDVRTGLNDPVDPDFLAACLEPPPVSAYGGATTTAPAPEAEAKSQPKPAKRSRKGAAK